MAFSKPIISVLSPTTFLFFKYIVFTDSVVLAVLVSSSRCGITAFLNGTVTFKPFTFSSLTSEIIFCISFSSSFFLS